MDCLQNLNVGKAQEKLDTAIKVFSSTNETLEDSLRKIEGLDNLEIDESGMYNVKIDGEEFLVFSHEVIPEDAEGEGEGEETVEVIDPETGEVLTKDGEEQENQEEENTENNEEINEETNEEKAEEVQEEEQKQEETENN